MYIKRDLIYLGVIENIVLAVLFTIISLYVLVKKRQNKRPDTSISLTWFFFQIKFIFYFIHWLIVLCNISRYEIMLNGSNKDL